MSEQAVFVAPHRATILVGYGAFGLTMLHRLLSSAAPRGVLAWEEPRGGAAPSERRLEDLALLWVPDQPGQDDGTASGGTAFEMMRDLHHQVEKVSDGLPQDVTFAEKLSEAAEKLLSVAARAGRRGALPLGLDVIVFAQPTSREAIGTLDRLLFLGMQKLANNKNLERAVQGAQALNFIEILDFDNYWDSSEQGRILRQAIHSSIVQWQARRVTGKPAFGRFYLVDRHTDDGNRNESQRIDEIILFVEFLLFEGQRDGELQRLYQSPLDLPVATFGIRLMERSAGLLRRLAAARFGIGWLEYLVGDGSFQPAEPQKVRRYLESFKPEALDALLDAPSLRNAVETELLALEQTLLGFPFAIADWPERVRERYLQSFRQIEAHVSRAAHARMADIAENHLRHLPVELRKAVDADLHDASNPVPLGRVIAEMKRSCAELEEGTEAASSVGEVGQLLGEIAELHSDYQQFNLQRVQVEGLRKWWPLLAVALSAGLTPLLHDLLTDVPKPDPTKFLLTKAFELLQRLNNPLIIGLLIFLAAWALGRLALQRQIAARVEFARRWYIDRDRGRFAGVLRRGLAAGGELRLPVDGYVDRVILDMALSVRGEVTRELRRVLERLEARQKEIRWLGDQLRLFLRMYGITSEDLRPESGPLRRGNGSVYRYSVERGEDLASMLAGNQERFRSEQASRAPFAGWEERYSSAFLVPLEFLDRLSRMYENPSQQELTGSGPGSEQERMTHELHSFLQANGKFSLGFLLKPQEGVPSAQSYCLLPTVWSRLTGIRLELRDRGIGEESTHLTGDTGRAYLLRVQIGVDPKSLAESA